MTDHVELGEVETEDLLDGLEAFLVKEVGGRHEAFRDLLENPRRVYGEDGRYSAEVRSLQKEIRVASADAGYYTLFVPEALGGAGLGARSWFLVWEKLFRWCSVESWLGWQSVAHWATGPSRVLAECAPEVRAEVLPELMSGQKSMCFAMSEPDAGTDVWMMRTTAVPDGDGWRLSGVKQWITNGPCADYALVFAVTNKELAAQRRGGISAFLIPTDSPGFELASVIRIFGHIGGNEAVFHLSDVPVSRRNLVGQLDNGFVIGQLGIGLGKLYNAAKAVSWGHWALAKAQEHVRDRRTFGRPLAEHQGVMFPLAESAAELMAARLMALHCADLYDRGLPSANEMAMTKMLATEAGFRTLDRVIQSFGGTGFTNELHLTDALLYLRSIRISDGSAEMMRRQIAKAIAKGQIVF